MNHNQIKSLNLDNEILNLLSQEPLTLKELFLKISIVCAYRTIINHLNILRKTGKIIKTAGKNYDLKHPLYKVIE